MKPLSKLFHAFGKAVNWCCGGAHLLGEIALFLLLLEVSYTVVMRYIFNNPPTWSEEIACYLFIFVVLLPIGGVLKDEHHIRLDIVLDRLLQHWKLLAQICISAIGLIFCLVLFYYGVKYVMFQYRFNFRSSTLLEFPYWITYSIVPAGFILISLQYIVKIQKYVFLLSNREKEMDSTER